MNALVLQSVLAEPALGYGQSHVDEMLRISIKSTRPLFSAIRDVGMKGSTVDGNLPDTLG